MGSIVGEQGPELIVPVSATKLMSGITLRVRLKHLGVLRARLRLAVRIIQIAGLVAGCTIELETDNGQPAQG